MRCICSCDSCYAGHARYTGVTSQQVPQLAQPNSVPTFCLPSIFAVGGTGTERTEEGTTVERIAIVTASVMTGVRKSAEVGLRSAAEAAPGETAAAAVARPQAVEVVVVVGLAAVAPVDPQLPLQPAVTQQTAETGASRARGIPGALVAVRRTQSARMPARAVRELGILTSGETDLLQRTSQSRNGPAMTLPHGRNHRRLQNAQTGKMTPGMAALGGMTGALTAAATEAAALLVSRNGMLPVKAVAAVSAAAALSAVWSATTAVTTGPMIESAAATTLTVAAAAAPHVHRNAAAMTCEMNALMIVAATAALSVAVVGGIAAAAVMTGVTAVIAREIKFAAGAPHLPPLLAAVAVAPAAALLAAVVAAQVQGPALTPATRVERCVGSVACMVHCSLVRVAPLCKVGTVSLLTKQTPPSGIEEP